ncbi:hypothetical protein HNY73_012254 [Argiope bruennichi]|uniref:Uncharacterized protein n=1 Tax=Argiope bruennichi TaxID=94029 RepID=A0A8T0F001_ARGBR|nr:hypothetical protein HNY73_012254 [Argiope bruennichi]
MATFIQQVTCIFRIKSNLKLCFIDPTIKQFSLKNSPSFSKWSAICSSQCPTPLFLEDPSNLQIVITFMFERFSAEITQKFDGRLLFRAMDLINKKCGKENFSLLSFYPENFSMKQTWK